MNIVRPSGFDSQKLPIGLFIHGGSFITGSGGQPLYNISFLVQNAVEAGKPFIGITINYRLSDWGFLGGNQILLEGNTNNGLRDQRLALHWVQENIQAFGGMFPTSVVQRHELDY
jgi:carboxylesterase type B